VSDNSSVHHQEFFTVHAAMLTACELASCQQTCMTYTIAVCTVEKTPDDGKRNCAKHIDFYSKNKFEKLVHLVGFIIRINLCGYFQASHLEFVHFKYSPASAFLISVRGTKAIHLPPVFCARLIYNENVLTLNVQTNT